MDAFELTFEHSYIGLEKSEALNSAFWEGALLPLDADFWTHKTGGNLCFVGAETNARINLLVQFDGQKFSCAHSVWDPADHSKNKLFFSCSDTATMHEPLVVLDETDVPRGSMISSEETFGVIMHFLNSKGERDPQMNWEDAENVFLPSFE